MINISSMFAKSPFKPMRDHMDKVIESITPLKEILKHPTRRIFQKSKKFSNIFQKLKKKQTKSKTRFVIIYREVFSCREIDVICWKCSICRIQLQMWHRTLQIY